MVVEVGAALAGVYVTIPVTWRAAGFERLFPTFEGVVELRPAGSESELHLHGNYAVPLGSMGRFGDGVVGRRIARRTAALFLEAAATRIDAAVAKRPVVANEAD